MVRGPQVRITPTDTENKNDNVSISICKIYPCVWIKDKITVVKLYDCPVELIYKNKSIYWIMAGLKNNNHQDHDSRWLSWFITVIEKIISKENIPRNFELLAKVVRIL